jgi:hypothetical protein
MTSKFDSKNVPAVKKNGVFWDVTPCGSCKNRRFGGTYRFHHQGDKNQRTRNLAVTRNEARCEEISSQRVSLRLTAKFLVLRFLSPWWWKRYVPPKRRFLQDPHGVTSQKTQFFIVTAVNTSNLTSQLLIQSCRRNSQVLFGKLTLHRQQHSQQFPVGQTEIPLPVRLFVSVQRQPFQFPQVVEALQDHSIM